MPRPLRATSTALALLALSPLALASNETTSDALLDGLLAGRDLLAAPPGVDGGTWSRVVPSDNEMTTARVALGRRLYFETALSRDGRASCATCHDPKRGFADGRAVSVGVGGKLGTRNAPTVLNAALLPNQFWDGRAATLEDQAGGPILNPIEMGMPSPTAALAALRQRGYAPAFEAAYGRAMSYADVTRAIAAFERTLVFVRSPFDRYVAGETDAISAAARDGWRVFRGRGRCLTCHELKASAPLGTDHRFRNIGISARQAGFEELAAEALAIKDDAAALERLGKSKDLAPLGRFAITRDPADLGSFRTSPLRNVGLTAPYMHDGALATLWDVIDYYDNGGTPHAQLDKDMLPLELRPEEIDQLVAFLFSLSDERFAAQNEAEWQRQRHIAETSRPVRDQTGFLVRVPRSHSARHQ